MIAEERLFNIIIEMHGNTIYARLLMQSREVVSFIKFIPDGILPEDAAEDALREIFKRLEAKKHEMSRRCGLVSN